jgi:hypothetical protein
MAASPTNMPARQALHGICADGGKSVVYEGTMEISTLMG